MFTGLLSLIWVFLETFMKPAHFEVWNYPLEVSQIKRWLRVWRSVPHLSPVPWTERVSGDPRGGPSFPYPDCPHLHYTVWNNKLTSGSPNDTQNQLKFEKKNLFTLLCGLIFEHSSFHRVWKTSMRNINVFCVVLFHGNHVSGACPNMYSCWVFEYFSHTLKCMNACIR